MPEISRFLGILIFMMWNEHLPPHFHAKYGEYEIVVEIEGGIVKGVFPKRALRLVLEWYEIHREELMTNWELCRDKQMPMSIAPLE